MIKFDEKSRLKTSFFNKLPASQNKKPRARYERLSSLVAKPMGGVGDNFQ